MFIELKHQAVIRTNTLKDAVSVKKAVVQNRNFGLIFIVKDGILKTPPVYHGALRGITRGVIIDLAAKLGIEVQRTTLTRHQLFNADECFLTGTAAEVIPVVEVDGRTIGDGKPGRTTKELMKRFKEVTKKEGSRYAV